MRCPAVARRVGKSRGSLPVRKVRGSFRRLLLQPVPDLPRGSTLHRLSDLRRRAPQSAAMTMAGARTRTVSAPDRQPKRRSRSFANECSAQVQLTERDAWILEMIKKMIFVTTCQIALLYFAGSRWSANKRLRRLLDGGFVRVWVRSLSEDNVYSLTHRGWLALERVCTKAPSTVAARSDGTLDHC